MDTLINHGLSKSDYKRKRACAHGQVGISERVLSVITGSLIIGLGLRNIVKRPMVAFSGLTAGSALVFRGIRGYCPLKSTLEDIVDPEREVTIVEHRYFVK